MLCCVALCYVVLPFFHHDRWISLLVEFVKGVLRVFRCVSVAVVSDGYNWFAGDIVNIERPVPSREATQTGGGGREGGRRERRRGERERRGERGRGGREGEERRERGGGGREGEEGERERRGGREGEEGKRKRRERGRGGRGRREGEEGGRGLGVDNSKEANCMRTVYMFMCTFV